MQYTIYAVEINVYVTYCICVLRNEQCIMDTNVEHKCYNFCLFFEIKKRKTQRKMNERKKEQGQ